MPTAQPPEPDPRTEALEQNVAAYRTRMQGITRLSEIFSIDFCRDEFPKGFKTTELQVFENRIVELFQDPSAQEAFLQELPFLTADQMRLFANWDRSQTSSHIWTWQYGDQFEARLALRLRETLLAGSPDPAVRGRLAETFLNYHWSDFTDEELKPVQERLDADPELAGAAKELRRNVKIRQAAIDPTP